MFSSNCHAQDDPPLRRHKDVNRHLSELGFVKSRERVLVLHLAGTSMDDLTERAVASLHGSRDSVSPMFAGPTAPGHNKRIKYPFTRSV